METYSAPSNPNLTFFNNSKVVLDGGAKVELPRWVFWVVVSEE
ncbi:hypothetical protein CCACVL1_29069 [Corchorus capsularis]|uniref:Uncharacterized protein n=1 Tax=Corchorus capsularis TaxID=210143 RepID=A0A1R3G3Z9_COCAP|nr:hypothetical protein CCACVL1_29069 [Corchorus capsularis]